MDRLPVRRVHYRRLWGYRVCVRTSLKKMMGAPGLAFETWDPSRKCRQTYLERNAQGLLSLYILETKTTGLTFLGPQAVSKSELPN